MATNKRTFPNDYFAWYNDDNRLAVVCEDTSSSSGEKTRERYDTYQDADVTGGLRITFSSKFETIDAQTDDLKTDGGLDSGLHTAVVCYLKSRMFEDAGDVQRAQYFRAMFDKMVRQYPARKSGVRALSVPRL
tara:strand:+ start:328 stop:726 length:399 start_codon:yes stop_codon:yes gene_type:complete